MENPLVSIVVPVYNVEDFIVRCVDSILCQTYSNIEVILVDDGSQDRSSEICDVYANKDSRVKVVHQSNGGISSARNCGIKNANGDFLMFVDGDDFVEKDYCAYALKLALEYKVDIVSFGYNDFYTDRIERQTIKENEERILTKEEALLELNGGKILSFAWNKIYRSSLFADISFPLGKKYEDIGTTYLLFDKANSVYLASGITYNYVKRSGSICSSLSVNDRIEWNEMEFQRYHFLEVKYPKLAINSQVISNITKYVLINLKEMYDVGGYKADKRKVESFLKEHKQMIRDSNFQDCMLDIFFLSPILFRLIRITKRILTK